MNDMFTKKVQIVGHGVGNLHILGYLNSIEQSVKDKVISRYIAIAPPFLGVVDYSVYPLALGEHIFFSDDRISQEQLTPLFKELMNKFPIVYELQVRDFFRRFRNYPWMLDIQRKVTIERTRSDRNVALEKDEENIDYQAEKQNPIFQNFNSGNKVKKSANNEFLEDDIQVLKANAEQL